MSRNVSSHIPAANQCRRIERIGELILTRKAAKADRRIKNFD
jgi:hypothetical protein